MAADTTGSLTAMETGAEEAGRRAKVGKLSMGIDTG